jgi:hypothetical protein
MKLVFGKANAKLVKLEKLTGMKLSTFSLLSGYTCPGAKDCQSFAVETPEGMRIRDGKHTKFRCFSASQEVLFPNVYKSRKHNTELLNIAAQSIEQAAGYIVDSIPPKSNLIRIHVAGDFKTLNYFDAWLNAIRQFPNKLFYAYTKSIPFWVKRKDSIPTNFILTASIGGQYDELALEHKFRTATVYENETMVPDGMPIDHTDEYAALPIHANTNFALLEHGIQKGRKAKYGYNKKKAGV